MLKTWRKMLFSDYPILALYIIAIGIIVIKTLHFDSKRKSKNKNEHDLQDIIYLLLH